MSLTYPPLFTPTRFSFATASSTSFLFVRPSRLSLAARKLSVDATTIAALEESPEPAGMVPDTSMSTGVGSCVPSLKNVFKTPWERGQDKYTATRQIREFVRAENEHNTPLSRSYPIVASSCLYLLTTHLHLERRHFGWRERV